MTFETFLSNEFPRQSPHYIRQDWDYRHLGYLVTLTLNDPGVGILQLPRFYFLSAEPTLASILLWPFAHIAYVFRLKFCFLVLVAALILASSYFVIMVAIILASILNRNRYIFIIMGIIFVIAIDKTVGVERLEIYGNLIEMAFAKSIDFFPENMVSEQAAGYLRSWFNKKIIINMQC